MSDTPTTPKPAAGDRLAALAGAPLTALLAVPVAAILLTWLPHYLTWPWWPDLDAYAAIAQGWDAGVRPYRDVIMFNFPGQVMIFWVLGKLVGWGHPAAFYALDAGLLLTLGVVLLVWSTRRFGRALPGLIGFAAALAYYAGQNYSQVAQRDWQGPLLAALAILIVQGWSGRRARLISAALFGLGLMIRPHGILFVPSIVLALDASARWPGEPWRASAQAVAEWLGVVVAAVALLFTPLAFQGLLPDFLRGVRQAAYGTSYSAVTAASIGRTLMEELAIPRISLVLAAGALGLIIARPAPRRMAAPWVLALAIALFYKPLHPRPHLYLIHPLWLFWSIGLAAAAGLALSLPAVARRPAAVIALGVVSLLLTLPAGPSLGRLPIRPPTWLRLGDLDVNLRLPTLPRFCKLDASLRALHDLRLPFDPAQAPPGAAHVFLPTREDAAYRWSDYRDLLAYLRREVGPRTLVANFLRRIPFPSVNGPVGRLTPWPAESGVIWLWSVDVAPEGRFLRALEAAPDSVVVWDPEEQSFDMRLPLDSIARHVRRLYRPAARFGKFEVWRRAGSAP